MIRLSLERLCSVVKGKPLTPPLRGAMSGVSVDSRTIRAGDLFVAISGEKFDGHDFLIPARQARACGALVERDVSPAAAGFPLIHVPDTVRALGDLAGWWRSQLDATFVGITGSVGKTTTRELAYHLVSRSRRTIQARKSFNNAIGVPLTIFEASPETEAVILEMGTSAPGEISRLAEIADVDIGAVLNVGPSHLEQLGDLAGVARAKGELLESLSASSTAVTNCDDSWVRKISAGCKARSVTFGIERPADFHADSVEPADLGWRFRLNGRDAVALEIPGRHNVYNALAAIAIAHELGVEAGQMLGAFAGFRLPGLRMERVVAGGVVVYNDTYNSNPVSLAAAVDEICTRHPAARKVLVAGPMLELGLMSKALHVKLGAHFVAKGIDVLYALSGEAAPFAKGARDAGMPGENIHSVAGSGELAEMLCGTLAAGDVVLFKASRAIGLEAAARNVVKRLSGRVAGASHPVNHL